MNKMVDDFVYKNINWLLLLLSLAAVVGSLSFSEIVGFPPCELCWIQRIFMYPQAIIAFCALIIIPLVVVIIICKLALSVIALSVIALYLIALYS